MNIEIIYILGVIFVGLSATLVMDLWALFLKRTFNIASLNYCLVGRWLCHMPDGRFRHNSIGAAPQKRFECAVGWIAHYVIGVIFAFAFVIFTSASWLQQPTLIPALLFGIGTVIVPFFIMQPSFGLGIAGAKTPSPMQARLRSLMAHAVFGVGLYIGAVVLSLILRAYA